MTIWHIATAAGLVLLAIAGLALWRSGLVRVSVGAFVPSPEDTVAALRGVFDDAPVALIVTTPDGTITHFNPRAERLLLCTQAEAIGRSLLSFHDPRELAVHSPDGNLTFDTLLSSARTTGTADSEWTWWVKDGRQLTMRLSVRPLQSGLGYVVVAIDVTELRQEEAERRELDQRVHKLASLIPGAVYQYRLHPDHREEFTYVSPGVRALTGLSAEELTAAPHRLRELVLDGDRHLLKDLATKGRSVFRILKDGQVRWIMSVASAERPPGGGHLLYGFATDITEQKAVEAQLELAREQALVASRAKAEFLGNMSHEIRTPLNGILGLTELVLETKLESSQRESLDAVLKCGQTLVTLVNDVLELARLETGALTLEVVPFPVEAILTEVAGLIGPAAAEKGLELTIEVAPDVPLAVSGDPSRIRQLLINLLGNAVKFTEQGSVSLELTRTRQGLRFVVRDTGVGIPLEQQLTLGQPFTQLDTSTTRRHGGSGLGLALTRRMIDHMGGRFSFSSQPDVGTTFGVDLPLAPVTEPEATPPLNLHVLIASPSTALREATRRTLITAGATVTTLESLDAATQLPSDVHIALVDVRSIPLLIALRNANPSVGIIQLSPTTQVSEPVPGVLRLTRPVLPGTLLRVLRERRTHRPDAEPSPPVGTPQGLTVLLAEDNPVNAKVVSTLLRREGHFVVQAPDGHAAVAAYEVGEFDLVLMDVQMPDCDGLEATRIIRRIERTRGTHIPIIALTASAMTGDIGRCLDAGMDDFLSKPLNLSQLRSRIRALVPTPPSAMAPPCSAAPAPAPSSPELLLSASRRGCG